MRKDGLCLQCGGEREMPDSKMHREQAEVDPFCSRECATLWHHENNGVEIVKSAVWGDAPGRSPGYEFDAPDRKRKRQSRTSS